MNLKLPAVAARPLQPSDLFRVNSSFTMSM
jgi:hypothetical protein